MAEVANAVAESITTPEAEVVQTQSPIIYKGSPNNLVPGIAFFFGGVTAFSMGITHTYFAEAMAWTFVIWGLLFIYTGLLEQNEIYEVTDDALLVRNPMRPWSLRKTFDWGRVTRLDVTVNRPDGKPEDVTMHVYYQPQGEVANERRDRIYTPALAAAIVERAALSPADKNTPKDVTRVPINEKTTYTWK